MQTQPTPSTVTVVTFDHEDEGAIYDPMVFGTPEAANAYMSRDGWDGSCVSGWEREPENDWYESATATTTRVRA